MKTPPGLLSGTPWMYAPCTEAVHRESTCPVHCECHHSVPSAENAIGGPRHTFVTFWEHRECPGSGHHKETTRKFLDDTVVYLVWDGWRHGLETEWGLFECAACLPAGETSEVNYIGKIPDVPKENYRDVPDGYTAWKLKMYLKQNTLGKLSEHSGCP